MIFSWGEGEEEEEVGVTVPDEEESRFPPLPGVSVFPSSSSAVARFEGNEIRKRERRLIGTSNRGSARMNRNKLNFIQYLNPVKT